MVDNGRYRNLAGLGYKVSKNVVGDNKVGELTQTMSSLIFPSKGSQWMLNC